MWIETKRLILRPWEDTREEAHQLYELAKDPLIGPKAGWPPHKDEEDSRRILHNILCTPEIYAVLTKRTGKPAGCAGITDERFGRPTLKKREGEIGYWIGMEYQGKGYASEAVEALLRRAFLELDMKTVWCAYYEGNEASARVQEKCGFLWHHSVEHTWLPLLKEYRTEHFTCITRKQWRERHTS